MSKIKFKPANGVTIDNAIEYAASIDKAVMEGIDTIPIDQRSIVIGMVAITLELTRKTLVAFKDKLEMEGRATPPTEEQLLKIQMLMRRAAEMDKKES